MQTYVIVFDGLPASPSGLLATVVTRSENTSVAVMDVGATVLG
jgi:hypothetical protein